MGDEHLFVLIALRGASRRVAIGADHANWRRRLRRSRRTWLGCRSRRSCGSGRTSRAGWAGRTRRARWAGFTAWTLRSWVALQAWYVASCYAKRKYYGKERPNELHRSSCPVLNSPRIVFSAVCYRTEVGTGVTKTRLRLSALTTLKSSCEVLPGAQRPSFTGQAPEQAQFQLFPPGTHRAPRSRM